MAGIIVVDGGPCTNPRLNYFIKAVEEVKSIDLMVLTHHDSDHIAGLLHYIKKHSTDNPFPVKVVWTNCSKHIDFETSSELSSHQAGKLADSLNGLQSEDKIQWRSDIYTECPIFDLDYVTLEILGPKPKTFRTFMEAYEDRESKLVTTPMSIVKKTDIDIPCRELAAREKVIPNPKDYKTLTNMASISFVLRCDGLSVLMLADSFTQEIVECLKSKGYSTENKLKIDFVKISHHGSQHNTSNELHDLIDCDNSLIFNYTNRSKKLFPDSSLEIHANAIRSSNVFSSKAYVEARNDFYSDKSDEFLNSYLKNQGVIISDEVDFSFTADEKNQCVKDWREGGESELLSKIIVRPVYTGDDLPNYGRETLFKK